MKRGMYEPKAGPLLVRPVKAHCTDRVRIEWTLSDGSTFVDTDRTCPTPEVIKAKRRVVAERKP